MTPALAMSLIGLVITLPTAAADDPSFVITSPQPWQVIQRVGYDPVSAANAEPGSPSFGSARVAISGTLPDTAPAHNAFEYRVVLIDGGAGKSTSWTRLPLGSNSLKGREFHVTVTIPAGGWYRLELQSTRDFSGPEAVGAVEPIGVGEVFLVAGQSYATNTNDERLRVGDPQGRVVAYDTAKNTWAVANDPQPAPDGSDGGSIWPALGDSLLKDLRVPIAFANVAVGGTSSAQWLPEGSLHPRLIQGGMALQRFRAVLWQQGESDVIAKTTVETYLANLRRIRKTAVRSWGFEPVWLAAKSTLHPTVYNDPEGEGRIRSAIEQLSAMPGFGAGPDTDTLTGDNRGDAKSRRHFSAIGQRRAAELWREVLVSRVNQVPMGIEAASFLLPDLNLLEPAWVSEIVNGESSVLRQSDASNSIIAQLAFPAEEIISVRSADRSHQFELYREYQHSPGQKSLQFEQTDAIEPIRDADLFPPVDSPNSYKHRVGHPDQNLLYRPGRWFHDHNVEVTYRRDLTAQPLTNFAVIHGSLPKTRARLKAGEPITIGISGDSISTGLDASIKTAAPPFQPGYPELVVAQLHVLFESDITLNNRAVSGWSVANGVADLDALLAGKPNLIIVAYGMNDVGRRDPQWFADQTRTLVDRIQTASPDTEIILVSPMLGNKEWIHTPREMFALYRDELKSLVSPGVAFADVTAVWELLLWNKHDLDLTGNGLNHPNDFGHRLYAQAVLQLLSLQER
jgi:lysophospholipase L1-like esterase